MDDVHDLGGAKGSAGRRWGGETAEGTLQPIAALALTICRRCSRGLRTNMRVRMVTWSAMVVSWGVWGISTHRVWPLEAHLASRSVNCQRPRTYQVDLRFPQALQAPYRQVELVKRLETAL